MDCRSLLSLERGKNRCAVQEPVIGLVVQQIFETVFQGGELEVITVLEELTGDYPLTFEENL